MSDSKTHTLQLTGVQPGCSGGRRAPSVGEEGMGRFGGGVMAWLLTGLVEPWEGEGLWQRLLSLRRYTDLKVPRVPRR